MAFPVDQPVIDTMIGFPRDGWEQYEYIRRQTKDAQSQTEFEFPAEYMFTTVPKDLPDDDPVAVTVAQMDSHNIQRGLVGVAHPIGQRAVREHPDRFLASWEFDANRGMEGLRELQRCHAEYDIRAVTVFPAGMFPQVAINDKLMYPLYAKCVELDLPVFCCAGIPGPRVKHECQYVGLIDEVMYDFPELTFVTRHGCEPWTDLMVKLMLKWPNLHYSTSAFAPKHYPRAILDYANTRGADRIIYAGYFPMGLSLERIFGDFASYPLFDDDVWPKFLYQNAARVLGVSA